MTETAVEPVEGEIVDTKKVRSRILEIRDEIGLRYYELAELLYEVKEGQFYRDWGFEFFKDYLAEEVGYEPRKGEYLRNIYNKWAITLELDMQLLKNVDWSKAKEIVKVVTEDNYYEWLEKAENLTLREIIALVKEARSQLEDGEDPEKGSVGEKFHRVTLSLSEDQFDVYKRALKLAEKTSDSTKSGHNFSLICSDFIASYFEPEEGGAKALIERMMGELERTFSDNDEKLVIKYEFVPVAKEEE